MLLLALNIFPKTKQHTFVVKICGWHIVSTTCLLGVRTWRTLLNDFSILSSIRRAEPGVSATVGVCFLEGEYKVYFINSQNKLTDYNLHEFYRTYAQYFLLIMFITRYTIKSFDNCLYVEFCLLFIDSPMLSFDIQYNL